MTTPRPTTLPGPRPPLGILFDLDGTLVDSALDFDTMRRDAGFPDGVGMLEHLATLPCPQQRAAAEAVILRHEMAGARRARWMPGAAELLQSIVSAGLPSGIVTRNCREATEHTLAGKALGRLPVVTREDAPPKPDPAGLLQIARQHQLNAADFAYIGDYRFDLEAARNAGMTAVLYVADGEVPAYAKLAHHVIHHFDELQVWLPEPQHE